MLERTRRVSWGDKNWMVTVRHEQSGDNIKFRLTPPAKWFPCMWAASEEMRGQILTLGWNDHVLLSNGLVRLSLCMHARVYSIIRSVTSFTCASSDPPDRKTKLQMEVISLLKTLSDNPSVWKRGISHVERPVRVTLHKQWPSHHLEVSFRRCQHLQASP